MKFNGAQLLIRLLERQGIARIAGIPGGASLPLYDALYTSSIRHTLARHEQGAGFIAQGMARTTGRPAVCFATSGPGATNAITAIADARMDSIPLITVTGQVPLPMIGTDAFQEVDTYGMTVPITKHNYLVRSARELLRIVPDAFRIAASGRPGPVVIDVPKDVQLQSLDIDALPEPGSPDRGANPCSADIESIAALIAEAKRPVFYIGGGVIASQGAAKALALVAEKASIPTVSTLMGLGAMPSRHPLFLGMLGMHAAPYTNMVLEECDLLIAAGVRFDDRATGKVSQFCPLAKIVHIDIDGSEIGKIKQPIIGMETDVGEALRMLADVTPVIDRPEWLGRIRHLRQNHALSLPNTRDPLQPYGLIEAVAEIMESRPIVTSDVGQHQMWVAQVYPFERPKQWLTSGGLGTMGFGLPAAIGAALADPDASVVCFSGDGSILMNVQELATLAEENLNVKVIVMNNGHLGLVRQQQHLFYGGRFVGARFECKQDIQAIAQAFGVTAWDLAAATDPSRTLRSALLAPGPCLINVPIDECEMVFPMVPPGAANREMIVGDRSNADKRQIGSRVESL